jgi:hypothetical protein
MQRQVPPRRSNRTADRSDILAKALIEVEGRLTKDPIAEDLVELIITGNGLSQLAESSVRVEWLKPGEYLAIPSALLVERNTLKIPDIKDKDAVRFFISNHHVHPSDVGLLREESMRHPDSMSANRSYEPKLQPETTTMIAAMNYDICKQIPLLAIARGLGVSCGLLPDWDSALNQEFVSTDSGPTEAALRVIQDLMNDENLIDDIPVAASALIARYGVEHLTYDHTLRQSDPTFKDRFNSVVNGSALPDALKNQMLRDQEVAMRTAIHPFGMASTLSFAYWAKEKNFVPENMKLRIPPVHHSHMAARVVGAGLKSLAALPIGSMFAQVYPQHILNCGTALVLVSTRPWEFSPLRRYYGSRNEATLAPDIRNSIEIMLPIVAGFVTAFAGSSALHRARSITKMKTRGDTTAEIWENAFSGYQKALQDQGIQNLLAQQASLQQSGPIVSQYSNIPQQIIPIQQPVTSNVVTQGGNVQNAQMGGTTSGVVQSTTSGSNI